MEFIVEQQAQLTASAQKRDEQIARHDEQIAKNSEQIAKHSEQIAALTDLVGRLAQAEIRLVERIEKSEGSQQEMRAAMTRLFERMDRFIQGLEGDGHKP
jgi:superoxide dismutase